MMVLTGELDLFQRESNMSMTRYSVSVIWRLLVGLLESMCIVIARLVFYPKLPAYLRTKS